MWSEEREYEPLYEYESDPGGAPRERLKKLQQLRQQIRTGKYDIDSQIHRLISDLGSGLSNGDESEEDNSLD